MADDTLYLWTGGCLLSTGIGGTTYMIHQQLKKGSSSYSLLSTSDVLAIFVTGVLFLVTGSKDTTQMTNYTVRDGSIPPDYVKCDYKTLLMNASLFLAPFVNAFMSIVAHSMACFCDAQCMTSTSEDKFNFPVPARLKDRRIGLSLIMPWLVPLITTGTLLSSNIQEDNVSLAKIYEDYNCNSLSPMEMHIVHQCFDERREDLANEESVTSYKLLKNEHAIISKYKSDVQKNFSEIQNKTASILKKIYSIVQESVNSPHNTQEMYDTNYSRERISKHHNIETREYAFRELDEDASVETEGTTLSQTNPFDNEIEKEEAMILVTTELQNTDLVKATTEVQNTEPIKTTAGLQTNKLVETTTELQNNEHVKATTAIQNNDLVNYETEPHITTPVYKTSSKPDTTTKYEEPSTMSSEFLVTFNGFPTNEQAISTENSTYDICFTTCSFASEFLKGHLFIIIFIAYFLPTATAIIIYTSTHQQLDKKEKSIESPKEELPENGQCSGVHSKMTAINRMILHMIIITLIFWTPSFIETLLRVWFCVSSPKWVTTSLFVLGQLHGIARSILNVKVVRLVTKGEVSTGLFKRSNGSIHPSIASGSNTEDNSKLFQKVKNLLKREEKPTAEDLQQDHK